MKPIANEIYNQYDNNNDYRESIWTKIIEQFQSSWCYNKTKDTLCLSNVLLFENTVKAIIKTKLKEYINENISNNQSV